MHKIKKIMAAIGKVMPDFLKRKVPRDEIPFFCVVGFLAALAASMLIGPAISALCSWATGNFGGVL